MMAGVEAPRDLKADLELCKAAQRPGCPNCAESPDTHDSCSVCRKVSQDTFTHEALIGWPHAIRRALAAEARAAELEAELERSEAQIDRLRNEINILQEQLERRCART